MLLCDFYADWIDTYKVGAIRANSLYRYRWAHGWLRKIAPDLELADLDKRAMQQIVNRFAETHGRTSTRDFVNICKAAIRDAVDEGLIPIDPTRRIVIKGAESSRKRKYLSAAELLHLAPRLVCDGSGARSGAVASHCSPDGSAPCVHWLLLLLARTGLRFSEAVGLRSGDFDFEAQTIRVERTWNSYERRISDTKNASSRRTIRIDDDLSQRFRRLVAPLDAELPIFAQSGVAITNTAVNLRLKKICRDLGLPEISAHGLRHTHASILLYRGVSANSVSKRLGHSNTTITQAVYLHVIDELELKDAHLIADAMAQFASSAKEVSR